MLHHQNSHMCIQKYINEAAVNSKYAATTMKLEQSETTTRGIEGHERQRNKQCQTEMRSCSRYYQTIKPYAEDSGILIFRHCNKKYFAFPSWVSALPVGSIISVLTKRKQQRFPCKANFPLIFGAILMSYESTAAILVAACSTIAKGDCVTSN
nr:uncharacterized protein LOC118680834 [Bactrocera oleae]